MLLRIASLIASGIASYASVSSTSQLWGSTLAHAPSRKIALTFDDGPNSDNTLRLLDVLAEAQVSATFFVIGRWAREQGDVLRSIASAGHRIGNHTDTHPNLFWCSRSRTKQELTRCQSAVEDVTGSAVTLFRPPFGFRRPDTLRIVRDQGLTPILWNVKCFDWKKTTAESVFGHMQRGILRNQRRDRGAIILLHDGGDRALGADRSHTIAAVRRLLAQYERERFVAL